MDQYLEFARNNAIWIVSALVSGGLLAWPMIRAQFSGTSVSPMQATIMINREDAVVVDVREVGEFGKGHIANSRHIPLTQFDKRLSELDRFREKPVILNCATGNRSMTALTALKKAGFQKVFTLAGGVTAWEQAGLPLTSR